MYWYLDKPPLHEITRAQASIAWGDPKASELRVRVVQSLFRRVLRPDPSLEYRKLWAYIPGDILIQNANKDLGH